jgi:fluoride exporter
MNQAILIFVGGGFGSLARFFIGKSVMGLMPTNFPAGTLIVNVSASLILGCFIGHELSHKLDNNYRALIAIGFCGGFSTFSTFGAETLQLFQSDRLIEAFTNILLNVIICILATFAGIYIAKMY